MSSTREILKRYVNFMNNPDEKTAVEQFGKGDKYFGVTLLLSTLPGLPMFGHGQIEGFAEKYGMEYRRPKLNETPDQGLIDYHSRMVFPILHKRYLFAEVEHFLLYDFYTPTGSVDENVFAYSNQFGDEKALVLYNNRHGETRGYVRSSAAFVDKGAGLRTTTLAEAFGLRNDSGYFLRFRDHVSGLEFLRSSREIHERGLYVELGEYKSHIFLDVREVYDADGQLAQLNVELAGHGVDSIDVAVQEYAFGSILSPFRALVNADTLRLLYGSRTLPESVMRGRAQPVDAILLETIEARALALLSEAARLSDGASDAAALAKTVCDDVASVLQLPCFDARFKGANIGAVLPDDIIAWAPLLAWSLINRLGEVKTDKASTPAVSSTVAMMREWMLDTALLDAFAALGMDAGAAQFALSTTRILISQREALGAMEALGAPMAPVATKGKRRSKNGADAKATDANDAVARRLKALLTDADMRRHVNVNLWDNVEYFSKESFDDLVRQLLALDLVLRERDQKADKEKAAVAKDAVRAKQVADGLLARAAAAQYRIDQT